MATVNATNLTLADLAARKDPNGAIARIIEMMTQETPLLQDMVWKEGNLDTGHRFTMRDGLPTLSWRSLNQGVAASKSSTSQVTEACGQLAAVSTIDSDELALSGDPAAARASEDMAFVTRFSNDLETAYFYSSTKATPNQIMGLSPRLDATTNPGGSQILLHDGSASGSDQASVWLVGWGDHTVHGIYPKGMNAGLQHKDLGESHVLDANNNKYLAYETNWKWNVGLCVKDWRYLVRIANIDTGNLSTSGHALIDSMVRAVEEKFQSTNGVRCAYYVNRRIASYLRLQALAQSANGTLTIESVGGKPVTMLGGIPVRRTDALLNTESVVS